MDSPPGARTRIGGRWRDYFSGTSYLGLQGHPGLLAAAANALYRYGLTTATSRGGYGEHPVYAAVESAAARTWEAEAALYFVSGYLGNAILLQGLREDYERVFVDGAAHFSVWDAAGAAGAPIESFAHLDAADLAARLQERLQPGERPLVITDGVFPVSGEIAPLPDLLSVLSSYEGALLCLDDAHATGVLGEQGRGTAEHYGSAASGVRIPSTHTLSKALGGHGGVIAGDAALVARLRDGPMPGASSPAPLPAAAASAWALDYMACHPERRQTLWRNVAYARRRLRVLGWNLPETPVPILCLHGRSEIDLARLQEALLARDLCVAHVTRYSSTPPGGALRVAIFATHSTEQIDRLVETMAELL
jgi:glycine C-acetyltransferase/8-amino-7-oxononanoate synthase